MYLSLPVVFAFHAGGPCLVIEVTAAQSNQFANAHTCRAQRFQYGNIAQPAKFLPGIVALRWSRTSGFDHLIHSIVAGKFGERPGCALAVSLEGVNHALLFPIVQMRCTFLLDKVVVPGQAGQVRSQRRLWHFAFGKMDLVQPFYVV